MQSTDRRGSIRLPIGGEPPSHLSPRLDAAAGCAYEGIELHLVADGDHRLADRLDHLWRITASFLEARELV